MAITLDDSDFQKKVSELLMKMDKKAPDMTKEVANAILLLSSKEVPIYTGSDKSHRGGDLQDSGFVEFKGDESIVGYNIAYAAYQHEGMRRDGSHVVRQYTNPRSKRKFLEDPIKNNMDVWLKLGVAVLAPILK